MTDRHTTNTTPATPLAPEREAEIRQTHPGYWYAGPWYSEYVDGQADEPAYYRVVHQESGTTLATLPDWAGPLALFVADAHDAVPVLLAELDRVRAKLDKERGRFEACAREASDAAQALDRVRAERDEALARVAELEQQAAKQRAAALAEAEQHLRGLAVAHLDSGCDFCNGVDWAADKVHALNTADQPAS